jgi:hypothetical protein
MSLSSEKKYMVLKPSKDSDVTVINIPMFQLGGRSEHIFTPNFATRYCHRLVFERYFRIIA